MSFTTNVLPTMSRSTTSCMQVIIERNNWHNTLCSSGDTSKKTDKNTVKENSGRMDWDYQPGDIVLVIQDGILNKVKASMTMNLGLSHQFIQMAQKGFKVEQNLKD